MRLMLRDIDAATKAFGLKMSNFKILDLAGLGLGWSKGGAENNKNRHALCEMDRRGQKQM